MLILQDHARRWLSYKILPDNRYLAKRWLSSKTLQVRSGQTLLSLAAIDALSLIERRNFPITLE